MHIDCSIEIHQTWRDLCIRQRLLTPGFRGKLEKRLRELAERDRHQDSNDQVIATKRAALAEIKRQRERISLNLALAENADQHKAIATIFDQVSQEEKVPELHLVQDRAVGEERAGSGG
jgi:hypothetical protein